MATPPTASDTPQLIPRWAMLTGLAVRTMHTTLDCMPCLLQLALRTARQVTTDEAVHERVMREANAALAAMDLHQPPPALAGPVFQSICRAVGVPDPLAALRERDNRRALDLVPTLRRRIETAPDPLAAALRVSAAANAIDFAAVGELPSHELERAIEEAMAQPLEEEVERFRQAVGGTADLLWLADNAGEIVLDGLLIERLPVERITVAVRGGPALNDAQRSDAEAAGLAAVCEIIDNGSTIPGTVLDDCSAEFVTRFRAAALVVAKGQGNYETLSSSSANVLFLLKVKCPVVAEQLGRPLGRIALVGPGGSPS